MITAEKNIIRTPVEELLLREMVMEDADFLIDNKDSEDDDMIVDNTSNGLFDNESEDDDLFDDGDEEEDKILGII